MAWYQNAERIEGNTGGSYTSGPFKGVLHTTEGRTVASALAAYRRNNSWPHFTVTYERGYFQCFQHVDTSTSSRALANRSGGVQTNRDSAIQIEIVGTCDARNGWGEQYVENFPKGYLDGIAALMRWIESVTGIQRVWMAAPVKAYPSSYGLGNGVRMSNHAWDTGSGWCGHQNVPENDHGDPGLINIAYLIGTNVVLPSPTPNPVANDGYLRVGARGQAVLDLQNALNFWGWNAGAADGIFGVQTKEAVRRAQRDLRVEADGVWGPTSRSAYEKFVKGLQALSAQNPPKNNGTGWMHQNHPELKQGATGGAVRHLQALVGTTQDGVFGPATDRAVRAKQRAFSLAQDGIVGPLTWSVLHSAARRGDSHPSVTEIQRELNINADGQFGPQTEEAVRVYQRTRGLSVDGIVGRQTYQAMLG